MKKTSNIIIKNQSGQRLFEAVGPGKGKYKFKGVFTQLSTKNDKHVNRNGRIYEVDKFLPHLDYLRTKIKEDGCVLGELDHPEERFEISLKEASHKITDIYLDRKDNTIKGTLELIDTPNGRIAMELVDAGYPIFVSSRAAGDVNKDKTVEISQLFTYDIVCTPGFKEARLERVSESLSPKAKKMLAEGAGVKADKNLNEKYGINDECTIVTETGTPMEIKEMNNNVDINSLTTPLNEEEITNGTNTQDLEIKDLSPTGTGDTVNEVDEPKDGDEDKKDGDEKPEDKGEDKKDEGDEDKKDKKDKDVFLDITVEEGEKKDKSVFLDITVEEKDDKPEEDNEEKPEEDKKDSEGDKEGDDKGEQPTEEGKSLPSIAKKVKKDTDADIARLQGLIKSVEKKAGVKESVYRKYPFARAFETSDFAKFNALKPEEKEMVSNFIFEHAIHTENDVRKLWTVPLNEARRNQSAWLRLASPEDRELFEKATPAEKRSIEASARFLVIESAEDAEDFWSRTGLRQKYARQLAEQQLTEVQKQLVETEDEELGYSKDFVNIIERQMAFY